MNATGSDRIEELLASMSLEEKLGEMTQLAPQFLGADESMDLTGPMEEMRLTPEDIRRVGSTLNSFGAKRNRALQDRHMAEHPHRIPLLFMADVVHGFRTVFPIPLALGCSFNPDVCAAAARTAAAESSAAGIHLTFAPMADLVRDPRWGRVMESPGEDPYLNSRMTQAAVRGFQGDDPRAPGRIAACVKHFAAYGAAESGRDYNTVDLSEGTLRQFYLPAYRAAVDAGVKMVMTAFNVVDRIPAGANTSLYQKILRGEWGFDGVVISDFAAVNETIAHGVAADGREAALKYIGNCDIEMMSTHYLSNARRLLDEGALTMDVIDGAVRRILRLKEELGLFENPYKDADEEREKELALCPAHRRTARETAAQCVVLLKNEGVLPLSREKARNGSLKIGLAGPFAETDHLEGGWALHDGSTVTLYDGVRGKTGGRPLALGMAEALGAMQQGVFDVPDHVNEACERLRECDVIIAAVGENPEDTGEGASRAHLRLSQNQEKLLRALHEMGKPVVAVIFSGRPLEIAPVLPFADAVLQAWFLGTEAGNAVADVLFGDYNPSGRLSMSFPQTVGQIPVYYNRYSTGRPDGGPGDRYYSHYLDCPNEPLFCFGYGLSYSAFTYDAPALTAEDDAVLVQVAVGNDSDIAGRETVQLYIRDISASVVRPVQELRGFRQIDLGPREKKTVEFRVTREDLTFCGGSLETIFEPGEFDIMVGRSSADVQTRRIYWESEGPARIL